MSNPLHRNGCVYCDELVDAATNARYCAQHLDYVRRRTVERRKKENAAKFPAKMWEAALRCFAVVQP